LEDRSFLFLQGPHGPFFSDLAGRLKDLGARVHRIGFNAGDGYFWAHKRDYTRNIVSIEHWAGVLGAFLDDNNITDLVLYGDTRAIHATAKKAAEARGITVHCFEEGYLRPYWVTYELGGVNGHSRLMDLSLADMRKMMFYRRDDVEAAPDQWGALYHHMLYGAIYHFVVLFFNRNYPAYRSHRTVGIAREAWLHVKRLTLLPWHAWERSRDIARLRRSKAPYHLVLLQLAHDASFRDHSDFGHIGEFIDACCKGFVEGAPEDHLLVFKSHPLEDGREPIAELIAGAAARYGLGERVRFIRGGKLGEFLDGATTAITVNSTAGQQALWRGLPLLVFGRSVYDKPELVSRQAVADFFRAPRRPDMDAYMLYREFLLETSQVPGGFYTATGRAEALRVLAPVIDARRDPYDLGYPASAARMSQISAE